MENVPFIGIGKNPNGPDMPVGFGMLLAQDESAMRTFGNLSNEQKGALISHIQGAQNGEEAKARVTNAVDQLRNGQTVF